MTSSLGKSLGKLTNCCYTTAGTAGTQQERTERRLSEFKTSAQGTAPGKKNVPIKEEIDETKGHGYLLDDKLQILQTTQCPHRPPTSVVICHRIYSLWLTPIITRLRVKVPSPRLWLE